MEKAYLIANRHGSSCLLLVEHDIQQSLPPSSLTVAVSPVHFTPQKLSTRRCGGRKWANATQSVTKCNEDCVDPFPAIRSLTRDEITLLWFMLILLETMPLGVRAAGAQAAESRAGACAVAVLDLRRLLDRRDQVPRAAPSAGCVTLLCYPTRAS